MSVVETYTSDDVKKFLKNRDSIANQKKLRNISRFLLSASGHYQNLILYFSTLHTMDYTLSPMTTDIGSINPKKFKKDYEEHAKVTEKMDISSSFLEARITSYVDGVFYGFARSTKDGFYIQKLDPDYCKITFIDPDTGFLHFLVYLKEY
jgi:type IV secretory pathway component VirB8